MILRRLKGGGSIGGKVGSGRESEKSTASMLSSLFQQRFSATKLGSDRPLNKSVSSGTWSSRLRSI